MVFDSNADVRSALPHYQHCHRARADKLIEWRHPVGHHWRWEFEALSPTRTRVTETFDYRDTGRVKDGLKYYERTGFAKRNAAGIEATLSKLRDRYQ